jgi:hypothetical protein
MSEQEDWELLLPPNSAEIDRLRARKRELLEPLGLEALLTVVVNREQSWVKDSSGEELLAALEPDVAKTHVINRRFMIVGKMVDNLIEPLASGTGFNIYGRGTHAALTEARGRTASDRRRRWPVPPAPIRPRAGTRCP